MDTLDSRSTTLIRRMVEAGRYPNADEAVREAVRLLDERERRLQWLRDEIALADAQIERGEVIEFTPELLDELSREAEANARAGKPIKDAVKP